MWRSAGVAVQVTQVTLDTVSTENRVSGKIVADSETSIMVASTAKCTEVYVQAGDEVEAGDKICRLDLESTLSSYSAASISYQSAASSYQDQKAIFDKQVALYEKNLKDTRPADCERGENLFPLAVCGLSHAECAADHTARPWYLRWNHRGEKDLRYGLCV